MARLFAVTQNTDCVTVGAQGMPQVTNGAASIWFYPTYSDTNTNRPMFSIRSSANTNRFDLYRDNTNVLRFRHQAGGAISDATSTTLPTLNAWNHLLVQWHPVATTGYVKGWLNGTAFTTQINSATVTSWTNSVSLLALGNFGADTTSPPGLNFSCGGRLADMIWWSLSAEMPANQISALAAGVNPLRIQPASIQGYWPLWGLASPEPNLISGSTSGTVTGATLANGPPRSLYTRRWGIAPEGVGTAGASFTATPATIPASHSGNITLTLTGTSTTWTSGSTVSIQNSVTGTTTVTAGTWTASSNTAATLVVTTAAGAGTYTVTVDGVVSPSLTVATATLSLSPTSGNTSASTSVTATGTNTLWATDHPAFTISGTGNTISGQSWTNNTSSPFTINASATPGTYTVTDPSTGATASFTTSSGPTLVPVTDANWYFAPWTWDSDGGGAMGANNIKGSSTKATANTMGAYFKVGFTGTTATLNMALNGLTSATATFLWRIDDGAWQTASPNSGTTINLTPVALSAGTHQLFFLWQILATASLHGWDASQADYAGFTVTGLLLDVGAASAACAGGNAVRPNTALFLGDSQMMANSSTLSGSNDARNSWIIGAAEALNCEYGALAYGSTAYCTAVSSPTSFPVADGLLLNYSLGRSRLISGGLSPVPTHILLGHGAKDVQLATANLTVKQALYNTGAAGEVLVDARAAAASSWIWVVVPTCRGNLATGTIVTALTSAVTAFNDAKCKLIDAGVSLAAGFSASATAGSTVWSSYDGVHMDVNTHKRFASKVVDLLQVAVDGTGATYIFAGGDNG